MIGPLLVEATSKAGAAVNIGYNLDSCLIRRCDMSKVDLRNIEKVSGRCGGRAVIGGTRIRVSVILLCHRHGMTVDEILRQYPRLRSADVYDALAYAADHPDEIEADLAADNEAAVQQNLSGDASPT